MTVLVIITTELIATAIVLAIVSVLYFFRWQYRGHKKKGTGQ